MTTDWIRKHVKSSLVSKYEQEMKKLRGEESNIKHVVDNIDKLNEQLDIEETEEQRRARDLEEDVTQEEYYRKNK
jgi:hypothetical protein